MAKVKWDAVDQRTVTEIQVELTHVLVQVNERKVEAALAVFALLRCARVLLDKYPAETREQLMQAIEPFLRGGTLGDASPLVIPGRVN